MAAKDLQSRHWHPVSRSTREDSLSHNSDEENLPAIVLSSLLRRRWWAIALISIVSGTVAYFTSEQVSNTSSEIETSLVHGGLPSLPGAQVYMEMSPDMCVAVITSPQTLNQLRERHGLSMPVSALAKSLDVKTRYRTELIDMKLQWADVDDGIGMLNDLSEIFIENVVQLRKERLREHMKHIELVSLEAGTAVDAAKQRIERLRREQSELLAADGQTSDQYRSILSKIANTQLAIDEKKLQELGIQQQMQAISERLNEAMARRNQAFSEIQAEATEGIIPLLEASKARYAEATKSRLRIDELIAHLRINAENLASSPANNNEDSESEKVSGERLGNKADLAKWQRDLAKQLTQFTEHLSTDDREAIRMTIQQVTVTGGEKINSLITEARELVKKMEDYELALIPVGNQLALLESRLEEYNKNARDMGGGMTGLASSQLEDAEHSLEKALARQAAYALQLDNMKQLEQCRIQEWAVRVPASIETATISSNRKKLGVLIFGMCGLVLGGPLLLLERQHCQALPQVQMVKSMGLPLLAERVLKDFIPNRQAPWMLDCDASGSQLEALRMLALRIQQSAHRQGTVILFTGMDNSVSSASLTSAVAQCLADREEKVLVVDAVSPGKTATPIANLLLPAIEANLGRTSVEQNPRGNTFLNASAANSSMESPGLSAYLAGKASTCEGVIQQSGIPNLDVLSSGSEPFHREAMATSRLTQLLEECRERYSIILIHGPTACSAADTQMLTARADGVIVLAGSKSHRNPKAKACIKDLIELGAPIIGVVA